MRNIRKPIGLLASIFMMLMMLLPAFARNATAEAQMYQVDLNFKAFYDRYGVVLIGNPISAPFEEISETNGKTYTVQYCERMPLELHPENNEENRVMVPLLGVVRWMETHQGMKPTYTATSYQIDPRFVTHYNQNGGLRIIGYPISNIVREKSAIDGNVYEMQYFERAVLEWHPENAAPYNVLGQLLGTMRYNQRYLGDPTNVARGDHYAIWGVPKHVDRANMDLPPVDSFYKNTLGAGSEMTLREPGKLIEENSWDTATTLDEYIACPEGDYLRIEANHFNADVDLNDKPVRMRVDAGPNAQGIADIRCRNADGSSPNDLNNQVHIYNHTAGHLKTGYTIGEAAGGFLSENEFNDVLDLIWAAGMNCGKEGCRTVFYLTLDVNTGAYNTMIQTSHRGKWQQTGTNW